MEALLNSERILSPIPTLRVKPVTPPPKIFFQVPLSRTKRCRSIKSVLDSAPVDELSNIRNPAVSTSYRNPRISKPNQTVLDAQTKVCTGPTQTKPLNAEQAFHVLDTILKSVKGELKDEEQVSNAQLGAFFAAMTIRANAFPEPTQWNEGERRAMTYFWPHLVRVLPPDIIFLADPEQSIMRVNSSIGPRFIGNGTSEMRLVGALREVLAGGHLGYEEVQGVLKDVLPLNLDDKKSGGVSESLLSAFLIGQRMNRETDRELKAYCLAFDDEHGPAPVADIRSLTHYGEPYDGNTRYFRSTLFVAAVRSCYGESCLLHGVDWMPPKVERIVNEIINKNLQKDPTLAPAMVRLFFHDCFVTGCDASILLDQTPTGEDVEKQAPHNGKFVRGFEAIDEIKARLEAECPGIVSCADILAFANRDSLVFSGVPNYNVPAGRRDGLASLAKNAEGNLPFPESTAEEITQLFERKGLSLEEMVVLTGAHSIGTAHCTIVAGRFRDPQKAKEIDRGYLLKMQVLTMCQNETQDLAFDPYSQQKMDSRFYKELLRNRALLESDQNLANEPNANGVMKKYVDDQNGWLAKFVASVTKLGEVEVLTGNQGEIRKQCRAVN